METKKYFLNTRFSKFPTVFAHVSFLLTIVNIFIISFFHIFLYVLLGINQIKL
jgi:hypothetical protein